MKFFGSSYNGAPLQAFSLPHLSVLASLCVLNFLLIFILVKIRKDSINNIVRICLAVFLLANEGCYQIWSIVNGIWTIDYTLPLQLCDAATILSAFMLLTKRQTLYDVAYFWGLGASLQALLTPDIYPYSFPHFVFFNFFLAHGAIITAVLFMTYIEGRRPYPVSMLKTLIATNAYMAVIALVDLITGGNYVFLRRKPSAASIMDLLGPWPWYILGLEAVGGVLMLLLYLPYFIKDFKRLGQSSHSA